jgi:hypothetical protein
LADLTKINWQSFNETPATTQFYPRFAYAGKVEAIGGSQDNSS